MKLSEKEILKKLIKKEQTNFIHKYPLSPNSFSDEDIIKGIEVLLTKKITMSSITKKFEEEFAKYIGSKYALMVNSGSSANLLAAFSLVNPLNKNKLKKGDECLIPSLCWSTSLWPIVQAGLTPKFVDIDPSTEFLVVQVFHQSWMTDPKIAHHFLTMLRGSIAGMKESQIGSTLSSLDVCLLLLLMINPSYRTDAQWCATVCLSNKSLGYSQLEEAVHRSKEPEWRQLGPALLEMLQVYLRVVAEAGWGTDGSRVYVNWIRRLLSSLYCVNREMRTPIIHTLIALVERSVRSQQVGGGRALFSQQSSEGQRRSYGGNETSGGRDKVGG